LIAKGVAESEERTLESSAERVRESVASEPHIPLARLLTAELRDDILHARIRPGQRLLQEQLAARFGTSRIPVREALSQLEGEGLVHLLPHAGARVVKLDPEELAEIYHVRGQLEPLAIRFSTPRLTDQQLKDLRLQVEEMEVVTKNPTPQNLLQFNLIDLRFHLATYAPARMPRLFRMIVPRMDVQYADHRLLIDALERRDAESAASIMEVHIRRTRLGLAGHPEIFDSPFLDWPAI
jgi:DNA-binding GntR family transcriptional regulator